MIFKAIFYVMACSLVHGHFEETHCLHTEGKSSAEEGSSNFLRNDYAYLPRLM